jgi:hypothetical protein
MVSMRRPSVSAKGGPVTFMLETRLKGCEAMLLLLEPRLPATPAAAP